MERTQPTQENNTNTEKLKQELANKERTLKVFERKATAGQKGEELALRQKEIEDIRTKIEQKKESSKEQGEKGVERVEKSGGEPEDIEDAKKAGEVLNTKTEEVAGEVEMSATDLFEQAQAMEAEQKATKPVEGGGSRELRSTVDVVMERYKEDELPEVSIPANSVNNSTFLTEGDANLLLVDTKVKAETPKRQEKTQSKWEKTKGILSDEQIRDQVVKTTAGTIASIAGVKSLYDVPAYLYQRFKVSGIFGRGKGLTGSVGELVVKSEENAGFGERYALWGEFAKVENDATLSADKKEEKLAELKRKLTETEPTKVRDAIENVNARLSLTKEGEQKHSDQRKLIAKVLWERRTKEKMSMDDVRMKMDSILDDYTTTKVSGMQAVRESLNTALVASGALSLRGISYGALDAVERKQRLDKEAKNQGLSLEERYQRLGDKNAKSVGKEATWWKDVFVGSIKETYQEAFAQGPEGRTAKQKIFDSIKAWGKIARYVGMGATMSFRPEAFASDMDKVLLTLSGTASFGDVAENFQGDIEKTIDGYKNIANRINPFSSEGSSTADNLEGGKGAGVEYQEGKRFPMGERPVEVIAPAPAKLGEIEESLIVQEGEGVSHALLRQLSDDPEKFGFTGDAKDVDAVTEWARSEVKDIVTGGGYWNQKTGDGVGVIGKGGDAAYEMEKGSDGHLKIHTYLKNDAGNFVKTETREVLKDLESAQLKTNMGTREYMRYGEPKEPIATPVTVIETPTKEALIVPEPSGEVTAEYQPPIYDTPKSALGSDTLERGEVYAEGVEEPTQKYTYNMPNEIDTEQPVSEPKVEHAVNIPESINYDQALSVAEKQVHNEINTILGSKGFLGFGVKDGMNSPDWNDRQVGFANATVENVMFPGTHTYGGDKTFGIKDSSATKEWQKLLTQRFNETKIQPKPNEKMGEYLTRTLMEKMGKGNARLTEVPIEPTNIPEQEKGLPEEQPKTDAEIKRDLKAWAREFDKDKDRFSRTGTPPVEQTPKVQ